MKNKNPGPAKKEEAPPEGTDLSQWERVLGRVGMNP
jgi:hypothetical protein